MTLLWSELLQYPVSSDESIPWWEPLSFATQCPVCTDSKHTYIILMSQILYVYHYHTDERVWYTIHSTACTISYQYVLSTLGDRFDTKCVPIRDKDDTFLPCLTARWCCMVPTLLCSLSWTHHHSVDTIYTNLLPLLYSCCFYKYKGLLSSRNYFDKRDTWYKRKIVTTLFFMFNIIYRCILLIKRQT